MTAAEIGVFGGSGFYELLETTETVDVDTPYGRPSAAPVVGEIGGRRVAFIPRHGADHRFPPHRDPVPRERLGDEGARGRQIFAPSASGSLQRDVKPGDFVICDQIVDRTRSRPVTFYDGPVTTHISFADPYCDVMRERHDRTRARARHPTARPRHGGRDRGASLLDAGRVGLVREPPDGRSST